MSDQERSPDLKASKRNSSPDSSDDMSDGPEKAQKVEEQAARKIDMDEDSDASDRPASGQQQAKRVHSPEAADSDDELESSPAMKDTGAKRKRDERDGQAEQRKGKTSSASEASDSDADDRNTPASKKTRDTDDDLDSDDDDDNDEDSKRLDQSGDMDDSDDDIRSGPVGGDDESEVKSRSYMEDGDDSRMGDDEDGHSQDGSAVGEDDRPPEDCPFTAETEHGDIEVLNLGTILFDLDGYHDTKYIYPVGYRVARTFQQKSEEGVESRRFLFEIKYDGAPPEGGPIFTVRESQEEKEHLFVSPDGVVEEISAQQYFTSDDPEFKLEGRELFGLNDSRIRSNIERLRGADSCVEYVTTDGEPATKRRRTAFLHAIAKGRKSKKQQQAERERIKLEQQRHKERQKREKEEAKERLRLERQKLAEEKERQKQERLQRRKEEKEQLLELKEKQKMEAQRKREEERELAKQEREKRLAEIDKLKEERREAVESHREEERKVKEQQKLAERLGSRQATVDDIELLKIYQTEEQWAEPLDEEEWGEKAAEFELDEVIEIVPPDVQGNHGMAEGHIDLVLEVFDFCNYFKQLLGCQNVGWTEFKKALRDPKGLLFHGLHVKLVRFLYQDLATEEDPFVGRPLNSLTWPELYRQYLKMMEVEYNYENSDSLVQKMQFGDLCEALEEESYDKLDFDRRLKLLVLNAHLAMETQVFHAHVDQLVENDIIIAAEKRKEFQIQLKEAKEKPVVTKPAAQTDISQGLEGMLSDLQSRILNELAYLAPMNPQEVTDALEITKEYTKMVQQAVAAGDPGFPRDVNKLRVLFSEELRQKLLPPDESDQWWFAVDHLFNTLRDGADDGGDLTADNGDDPLDASIQEIGHSQRRPGATVESYDLSDDESLGGDEDELPEGESALRDDAMDPISQMDGAEVECFDALPQTDGSDEGFDPNNPLGQLPLAMLGGNGRALNLSNSHSLLSATNLPSAASGQNRLSGSLSGASNLTSGLQAAALGSLGALQQQLRQQQTSELLNQRLGLLRGNPPSSSPGQVQAQAALQQQTELTKAMIQMQNTSNLIRQAQAQGLLSQSREGETLQGANLLQGEGLGFSSPSQRATQSEQYGQRGLQLPELRALQGSGGQGSRNDQAQDGLFELQRLKEKEEREFRMRKESRLDARPQARPDDTSSALSEALRQHLAGGTESLMTADEVDMLPEQDLVAQKSALHHEEEDFDQEELERQSLAEQAATLKAQLNVKPVKEASTGDSAGSKKTKDPNLPKRPRTAFFQYSQAIRESLRQEHPEVGFGELSKMIGKQWGEMGEEQKQEYFDLEDKDKLRYMEEMKEYNDKYGVSSASKKKKIKTEADENGDDGLDGSAKKKVLKPQTKKGKKANQPVNWVGCDKCNLWRFFEDGLHPSDIGDSWTCESAGRECGVLQMDEEFMRDWSEVVGEASEGQLKFVLENEPFSVFELYCAVECLGGSMNIVKWKDVGNEMMMRKKGHYVNAAPGKNYGIIKNQWERWVLYKFEEEYPARPLPAEYAQPLVEIKKRADPIAALREQLGVKSSQVKSPNEVSGTVSPSRAESTPVPQTVLPLLPPLPQHQPLPPLPVLSRDQLLQIRISKSATYDRGLRLDEVEVRKVVDLQFRQKLEEARYRQEPLGQDRFKRRYWVLGEDWSALWIEQLNDDDSRNWGCYTSIEKVDELLSKLDRFGARECALKDVLELNRDRFEKAMQPNQDMMEVESDGPSEDGLKALQTKHSDISFGAAKHRDPEIVQNFTQQLYSSDPEYEDARNFFGIESDLLSREAASIRISEGLTKLKGDLLLLELALQGCLEDEWQEERVKWLQDVRDSKTATDLDNALEDMIKSVNEGSIYAWYQGIPRTRQGQPLGDEYGQPDPMASHEQPEAMDTEGSSPNIPEETKEQINPVPVMRESTEAMLAVHLYGFDEAVVYKEKGSRKKKGRFAV